MAVSARTFNNTGPPSWRAQFLSHENKKVEDSKHNSIYSKPNKPYLYRNAVLFVPKQNFNVVSLFPLESISRR